MFAYDHNTNIFTYKDRSIFIYHIKQALFDKCKKIKKQEKREQEGKD